MESLLQLPFQEDRQLTEMMRLRVQSLEQRGQKRQEGERLLRPGELVYRLDFPQQNLRFARWAVRLSAPGRLTVVATSQHWTPDLTPLMTRQLLEPAGLFWRSPGDGDGDVPKCYEADTQEFGERIAELAKIRKVMFFLLEFEDGAEPATVDCAIVFRALQ
ncbi:olfactory marker protein a [Scleropages formosus]|uniref:Olfactory marker protein a n=1 Tax=Scleropages formosus TaxID=113540 RepID=A0A8C9U7L7_SCLFO|nr:olfactory marker protein [Scleropages formosus]